MPISINCPTCGNTLRAKDSAAGKTAKCPSCDEMITIPLVSDSRCSEDAVEEVFDEFEAIEEEPSLRMNSSHDKSPCPMCFEMIVTTAKKCRHCGEFLDDDLMDNFTDRNQPSRSRKSKLPTLHLAGLGSRFAARMADALMVLLIIIPGLGLFLRNLLQSKEQNSSLLAAIVSTTILGVIVVNGINIYMLATRSQSVGKWLLKIQIIDMKTDEPAGFVKAWVLRSFVNGMIGLIPSVGVAYSIIDILFIFGEERRCIHDQIAGTYVADIS